MWSSRMIIYRSRGWKVPADRTCRAIGASWVYDTDGDDKHKDKSVVGVPPPSRRYLNSGRRHGWKGEDEKKEKKHVTKELLDSAARGELDHKHSSGIPRTAARKSKGHAVHGVEEPGSNLDDVALEEIFTLGDNEGDDDDFLATLEMDMKMKKAKQGGGWNHSGAGAGAGGTGGVATTGMFLDGHGSSSSERNLSFLNVQRHPLRDPEYWNEEDYDLILTEEDRAFVKELAEMGGDGSKNDEDGAGEFDFDSIDWDADDSDNEEEETVEANEEPDSDEDGEPVNELEEIIAPSRGREKYGRKKYGEGEEDEQRISHYVKPYSSSPYDKKEESGHNFWVALKKHPAHYAEMRLYNLHPESKRIPQPIYPLNRTMPPPDFVNGFMRFMFVSGLPPTISEEGMSFGKGSKLNTLQEQEIERNVTRLLGVTAEQIFPANETSAYIGFHSPQERDALLYSGPKNKVLSAPLTMTKYSPASDEEKTDFVNEAAPGTLVKVENVPPGRFSRSTFARDLFPTESEFSAAYRISAENVVFPSPTTALLRFESAEQAESALASEFVATQLEELGQYPVRLFKARRDIVYDHMGGPAKQEEIWKLGPKIIVDGDMPSKHFYLSHAGAILLRGLDHATVSKESITEFFQPFSRTIRDVKGSVEFVTCEGGLPTDRAYVGFDFLGEAETVMKAFSGRAKIGDNVVKMKLLKDRWMPNAKPKQQRPERSEEEILRNLHDWEQYVDPEDIKYLEENGVPKQVLDESLRGIRYYNRSFGSLDWAMRDEKLEPEKESGDDYKELVKMYVTTLKECIATPENPGDTFKGLHFPGEPLDLSIFEKEKKRQEELLKKRGGL